MAEDGEIVIVGSDTRFRGPNGSQEFSRIRGPAGDIQGTGRSVTLQLCDVHDIRDGKIRRLSAYFDSASLRQQLGVMPEAGAEAKT